MAGALLHPESYVPLAGTLTQLRYHLTGVCHLVKAVAGTASQGGADEQLRRQPDQRRR